MRIDGTAPLPAAIGARTPSRCGGAQAGLTLVELMVSMTIGLLIVGAVLYVYLGSRGAYRTSKSTSRIQEAGRFGTDAILRDVRQVGYIGCGSRISLQSYAPPQINEIANPPPLPVTTPPPLTMSQLGLVVLGFSASSYQPGAAVSWPAPPGLTVPRTAGDVLVLPITTSAPLGMVKDPDPTVPAIFLANNCGGKITTDSLLMVSSCTMATVLRVSNAPDTTATACPANGAVVAGGVRVEHGAVDVNGKTVNGNPPNNSTALTLPLQPALTIAAMPSVQAFDEVSYYVGQFPGNVRPPALYRYSAVAGAAEEIIDHVENLCAVYGVAGAGNVVFQTADQVSQNNAWPSVVSVRISLMVAGDELGAVDAPQTLPFCGANITAPDTRLRQVFTATGALRDRLQ
jgi:type IV pilus assembly protein PilW